MATVIILDSGPLGMVTNPRAKSSDCLTCQQWLKAQLNQGKTIAIPEIADYEVRRELRRANRLASIRQLDQLKALVLYLPIDTQTMLRAAELWAIARQVGQPTADPKALDGDVILAAQVLTAFSPDVETVVATSNVSHIARFTAARRWQDC